MGMPALGLVVVCSVHFLIGADGLAVAITLPHVQQTFEVATVDAQWVLTGYGVFFGSFMLLAGRLGDLYGRRRLLVSGMVLFAGGSLLAGIAPALGWLIFGRVLQGLGAAAGVPAALALIGGLYPSGPARTRALSLLAAMATMGIMSGLVVGGVIIENFGWRWVFLLLAIPSVVTALIAPFVLPETEDRGTTGLDVTGAVLTCTGLMALLFGFTRIEHDGPLAVRPLLSLLAGVVLLTAFVAWERRTPVPLMRFGILRVAGLRAGSLGVVANGMAFMSVVYAGTLYLQNTLGYSASEAAFAILPTNVVSVGIALAAGTFVRRSPRVVLSTCFALTVASLLWLARSPVPMNYLTDLLPPMVVLGMALTTVFIISTHQAVAGVDEDEKGLASGIFETANHLFGGAVSVAVYATVVAAVASGPHDASGYRAAFLTAAALVVMFGAAAVSQSRSEQRTAVGRCGSR